MICGAKWMDDVVLFGFVFLGMATKVDEIGLFSFFLCLSISYKANVIRKPTRCIVPLGSRAIGDLTDK